MSSEAAAPTFTHVEQILLRKLRARRGDVAISVLFMAAYDVSFRDLPLSRNMQQRLGPRITELNRKLEAGGERVVPGRLKRTYRLQKTDETVSAAE